MSCIKTWHADNARKYLSSLFQFFLSTGYFWWNISCSHHNKMVLLKERINTWLKPPVPYFTIMFLFAPWVMHFSQLVIQLIACHHLFFTSRFPTLSCISIKSLPCSSHCLWLHYKVNSTKSLKCIFLGYSPPLKGLSHWFGT